MHLWWSGDRVGDKINCELLFFICKFHKRNLVTSSKWFWEECTVVIVYCHDTKTKPSIMNTRLIWSEVCAAKICLQDFVISSLSPQWFECNGKSFFPAAAAACWHTGKTCWIEMRTSSYSLSSSFSGVLSIEALRVVALTRTKAMQDRKVKELLGKELTRTSKTKQVQNLFE